MQLETKDDLQTRIRIITENCEPLIRALDTLDQHTLKLASIRKRYSDIKSHSLPAERETQLGEIETAIVNVYQSFLGECSQRSATDLTISLLDQLKKTSEKILQQIKVSHDTWHVTLPFFGNSLQFEIPHWDSELYGVVKETLDSLAFS